MNPINIGLGLSIAPLSITLTAVLSVTRDEQVFSPVAERCPHLVFQFEVLHRDTYEPCKVEIARAIELERVPFGCKPEEWLYREVRQVLIEVMSHEIDEVLRINGKRVREPHP